MAFESLLVSRDPTVFWIVDKVLRDLAINVDHCETSSVGCDVVAKGSHELVVIDWEGEASSQLLHVIWMLPQKRKPTLLAICDAACHVPGVHLALGKPFTLESVAASLKTAYSRMLLDYRLNARFAVMTPATAIDGNNRNIRVKITDIGDGGVGLTSKEKLTIGDQLSLSLQLADTARLIHFRTRVVWTREYGTAGCEILSIPPVDRDILREWLKAKIHVKKPLIPV
jgi:DNA-binding response OmpR family regulator